MDTPEQAGLVIAGRHGLASWGERRALSSVEGPGGTLTFTPPEPQLAVPAEALAGMTGTVTINVSQIGDFAESRAVIGSVMI